MDIFHDALVQWFLTLTVMQELSFKAVFKCTNSRCEDHQLNAVGHMVMEP